MSNDESLIYVQVIECFTMIISGFWLAEIAISDY